MVGSELNPALAKWKDGIRRCFEKHSFSPVVAFVVLAVSVFCLPPIEVRDGINNGSIKLVSLSSMVYSLLDPLFLYAPLINRDTKCLVLDNRLKIAALVFRSWGDLHYLFKIYVCLKDGWRKCLTFEKMSGLASDTVSVLPIPQVAILIFLPKMRGSNSLKTMKILNFLIVLQYVPRVYPLYLLCKNVNTLNIGNRGAKHPSVLITVNIYGYIIASHIFGAFWYFFSIQREIECWGHACRIENGCEFSTSCVQTPYRNITLLENLCPINPPDKQVFDFGIFHDALQSGMQGSTNFLQKFLRCFSWGLRNLSSFGSNLGDTSAYGWENLFVVLISISGLVLFMYLLGHVQTFMQKLSKFKTITEKMETIGPNIQSILSEYGLSNEMETKIKRAVRKKLEEDENHIVENMFSILSLKEAESFAADIKCTLFLHKLEKVDGLKDKGEEVWKNICEHLEPVIYSEGNYIIREGEPLDMIFFVTRGSVLTYATNNGGSNGSSGTIQFQKEKDGFYGEKLLTWAIGPSSNLWNLPISPITVKSHKKAEIFALKATDLWSLLNMDNTTLTVAAQ